MFFINRRAKLFKKWLLLVLISITILVFDVFSSYHSSIRICLNQVLYQFNIVANSPVNTYAFLIENLQSRSNLIKENKSLQLDMIIMQAKMHGLLHAGEENKILKELLSFSVTINSDFAVAAVIAQHTGSIKKYIVIDKGSEDDAYVGQAVVDTKGVIGNIVEIAAYNSKVLLITDKNNAIPVQNKTGNRAIVMGGDKYNLHMLDITETNDFAVGQKLYTSGLGSRYMSGYPVGTILSMNIVDGKNFMEVKVKPSANIYEAKYVVLVWAHSKDTVQNKNTEKQGDDNNE
jgi:rod shape-determining protein MreC